MINQGRLDCAERPEVVRTWLRAGRKYGAPPNIPELSAYTAAWQAWWMHLQPDSRKQSVVPAAKRPLQEGESWHRTCIAGPNGIFMVVLTLGWWLLKLDGNAEDKDLMGALEDVEWVISAMTVVSVAQKSTGSSSSRKRSTAPDDESEPARKR
jgi:hypothetical protein